MLLNKETTMGVLVIRTTNGELYHHGIKGQKWGVTHDQYPLDASDHTAAERKAGWRQSLDSNVKDKRSSYRIAKKDFKQANKAYKKKKGLHITKKGREEKKSLLEEANNKNTLLKEKKQNLKDAKKERRDVTIQKGKDKVAATKVGQKWTSLSPEKRQKIKTAAKVTVGALAVLKVASVVATGVAMKKGSDFVTSGRMGSSLSSLSMSDLRALDLY